MSNQYEASASTQNSSGKSFLIVIGVLITMSCFSITMISCAAGAFFLWLDKFQPGHYQTSWEVPTPPEITSREDLDVTRAEMIDFYSADGAFEFTNPVMEDGIELVKGTHTSICQGEDCAVVALGGPEKQLQIITLTVPTNPKDTAGTSRATAILMKTARRFADPKDPVNVSTQIMTDILQAQAKQAMLRKAIMDYGYVFTITFDPESQQARLRITPSSDFLGPSGSIPPELMVIDGAAFHHAI